MTRSWNVAIYLFDEDEDEPTRRVVTKAHAVLTTSSGATLDGHGRSERAATSHRVTPGDPSESVAAAAALRDLTHHLLRAGSEHVSENQRDEVEIVR